MAVTIYRSLWIALSCTDSHCNVQMEECFTILSQLLIPLVYKAPSLPILSLTMASILSHLDCIWPHYIFFKISDITCMLHGPNSEVSVQVNVQAGSLDPPVHIESYTFSRRYILVSLTPPKLCPHSVQEFFSQTRHSSNHKDIGKHCVNTHITWMMCNCQLLTIIPISLVIVQLICFYLAPI